MAEPTTPSKSITGLCRLCGERFSNPRNKHNLFIKNNKQDYALVFEELTGASVTSDDALKAVCGTCRHKLNKYRRCTEEITKAADEIKHLALLNQPARVKRCAKTAPSPHKSRERKKLFTAEETSSPARRSLFHVPTCTNVAMTSVASTDSWGYLRSSSPPLSQPQTTSSPTSGEGAVRKKTSTAATVLSAQQPQAQQETQTADIQQPIHRVVWSPTHSGPTKLRQTKISVKNRTSSRSRIITGPYETVIDNILRSRDKNIPHAIMAVPGMSDMVVEEVLKKMNKECKILSSLKFKSKLRQTKVKALKDFKWLDVIAEWRENAPTYNRFLESASNVPKDPPHPTSPLKPRALKYSQSKTCTMAMAGATLLRARCQSMTAPLYLNALVMRHGGAKRRCFERLVKLGVCVSPASALQKVKDIAHSWDRKVIKWKEAVCKLYIAAHPPADAIDRRAEDFPAPAAANTMDTSADHISIRRAGDPLPGGASDEDCLSQLEPTVEYQQPTGSGPIEEQGAATQSGDISSCESYESADSEESSDAPGDSKEGSDQSADSDEEETTGLLPMQITIDNLDRSVTPHTMTKDNQRKDNHWMIMLANQERVSASHLPQFNNRSVRGVSITDIVPNQDDQRHLKQEFKELVGRVLVSQLPEFSQFKDNVKLHIPHLYSSTMAKKTEIIPLGILDADEKQPKDMIRTMKYINDKYVPYVAVEGDGETYAVMKPAVQVILAGDQLTKQNSDVALRAIMNREDGIPNGIVTKVSDFHCSMNTNDVIFKDYYNTASNNEKGTMFQLRNLIDRRNVSASALGDKYTASNTFIQDVADASIISASLHYFGMDTIEDTPTKNTIPAMFSSDEQKQNWLDKHLLNIVDAYILNDTFEIGATATDADWETHVATQAEKAIQCRFPNCTDFTFKNHKKLKEHIQDKHNAVLNYYGDQKSTSSESQGNDNSDGVFNYHSGFLKVALLERDFQDSIKEGDGQRTCRLWKLKMLNFKQAGRIKYSLEALRLQLDIAAMQSPSVSHRLVWNRTVNTSGIAGKNIALDLNCEHYVQYTKEIMDRQGANLQFDIAQELSRSIGEMKIIMDQFDKDCGVSPKSGRHTVANKDADIRAMVTVLHGNDVFSIKPGRSYSSFKNKSANPLHKLKAANVVQWILDHKKKSHMVQVDQRVK